ncbi:hypothetical protein CNR22_01755 [Sphingobacteriaceae bacterium]|nr:hypothetical protein CNR22_01755 [Sphingobacteriaceae bacterium]
MKTKDLPHTVLASLTKTDKRSLPYLKQILSPLELSALRHNYQPFNYKFEGHFIYISGRACKQLLETTKTQLSFFTNQVEKQRYMRSIPRKHREVFEDPAQVLSLPPHLRNKLCNLQIYTLLRIMILGRSYFENHKAFGRKSIKVLEELFENYHCGHLFR